MRSFREFCREAMDAPTDNNGNLLSKFELSVDQFRDELADMKDYDTVEVTLDDEDPTKVLLKFPVAEDRGGD